MPILRQARPPSSLSSSPRSSLDASRYKPIDVALKDLQICSRRLQAALSVHGDELQILERLYYKGKNQHRSALFWKRVMEIRRNGHRLDEMGILAVVDRLRSSFFAERVQGKKAFKGPWTSIPDPSLVSFTLHRMQSCSILVEKMQSRLLEAYHFFTLALRSGAFTQLALTLAAIASRMYTLALEINTALVLGSTTCNRMLPILNPTTHMQSIKSNRANMTHTGAATDPDLPSPVTAPDDDPPNEDTGCPITRQASSRPEGTHPRVVRPGISPDTRPAGIDVPDDGDNNDDDDGDTLSGFSMIQQSLSAVPIISKVIFPSEGGKNPPDPDVSGAPKSGSSPQRVTCLESKGRTKKRRRRDEIDDIFGT